jgi:hypothetical protein
MKSFKQYLSESDPKSWTVPGYSYDGQDPNLRSDEDVEKTKQWVKNVVDSVASYKNRQGDTVQLSSQVDASGRPTGENIRKTIESDENRAKREEQEAVKMAIEREPIIQRQRWQEEDERDRKEAMQRGIFLDDYYKMKKRDKQQKEKEQELRRRPGIPMNELA